MSQYHSSGAMEVVNIDDTGNIIGTATAPIQVQNPDAANPVRVSGLDEVSSWTETVVGAAATEVVVTRPAEAGLSHYVTAITASFSAAQIALLTLEFPALTVEANIHVHNAVTVVLPKPLRLPVNTAAVARLAAGAAGVIGAVTMFGYTR